MDLYFPPRPKIAFVGDRAAPGAHPLTWLAKQCEINVYSESRINDSIRDVARSHVLLLDVHSINAHLICQQLHQDECSLHLPVLGVGNRLPPQDVIRLLHHGAVDVVTLPIDYQILLAKIRTLAYRHIEMTMMRTINHTLIRDLEGLRAALLSSGRAIAGLSGEAGPGERDEFISGSCTAPILSQVDSRELLEQIEQRAAALPDHVALFVISALASTELLPLNLSSLILNSLTRRIPLSKLGPIHHAFAALVQRHLLSSSPAGAQSTEMAMLQACGSSGPSIEALRFVADLPNLLRR